MARRQASASASVASGTDGHRIDHHAALKAFDAADLLGLFLDGEILMDDAHAAGLGHGDGEPRLGHRVHRRGNERDAEFNAFGEAGSGIDLTGQNLRRARNQQHIVEG